MSKTTPQAPVESDQGQEPALVHVDPATLVIETNVRTDVEVDQGLVDSITERGVLVPVVAHRNEAGALAVLYGQRRTLAAVRAGRATIPVQIVATPAETDRLVDQMGENDHRAGLRVGERIAAYAQMSALGLSAAQIAKRTATKSSEVKAALTTATSAFATQAADAYERLTLEQAAILTEFEDTPAMAEALLEAVQRGNFDHKVQLLRDQRERDQRIADRAEQVRGGGVTVIERPAFDALPKNIERLRQDGEVITPQGHAGCPGHAAYIACSFEMTTPATRGAADEIDAEDPQDDEQAQDVDPDEEPGGYDEDDDEEEDEEEQVGSVSTWGEVLREVYVCTNPKANGHTFVADAMSGRLPAAQVSETERAQRSAERREVVESNRAWVSAEKVRREFLATFARRKSAPTGTPRFVAEAITHSAVLLARAADHRHDLAAALLGIAPNTRTYGPPALVGETTTPARTQVITLVVILAAYEKSTHRASWRNVDAGTARYLAFLAAAGYPLADIERTAAGLDLAPAAQAAGQADAEQQDEQEAAAA